MSDILGFMLNRSTDGSFCKIKYLNIFVTCKIKRRKVRFKSDGPYLFNCGMQQIYYFILFFRESRSIDFHDIGALLFGNNCDR